MPIFQVVVADEAQVSDAAEIGGGLIAAVHLPTGMASATVGFEYSPDGGTTWDPINDESATPLAITYLAGGALHQINPPVRAPLVRLTTASAENSGPFTCEIHTV